MQKIKLQLLYLGYTWMARIANTIYAAYYKIRYRENKLDEINSLFMAVDEVPYIALITKFLQHNYAYADNEKIDIPRHPEWFLRGKTYNCNDISYCILSFLAKFRPWLDAKLMIIYAPNERGHCVCLINVKDGFIHASNYGTVKYFNTEEDAAVNIYQNWNYYVICDSRLRLKRIVINKD